MLKPAEFTTEILENTINKGAEAAFLFLLKDAGADIVRVNDPSFYRRVLAQGTIGLGDSYVEGQWDCDHIDEFIYQILSSGVYQKLAPIYGIVNEVKRRLLNLQNPEKAKEVIDVHYDLPAEFYEAFLGPLKKYTCLDYTGTDDIEVAEVQSMRKCEKLELEPGQKILDLGGGWGGPAHFMAEEYGVKPTVVTLSTKQAAYIIEKYGDQIEVIECDYREIPEHLAGTFDAVSAIGVLEHVGYKNYEEFFRIANHNLKEGGKMLTHTLYNPYSRVVSNPWVEKNIFPGGEISPRPLIENEIRMSGFKPASASKHPTFEDISIHYPPTLHAWKNRMGQARKEGRLQITNEEFRKFEFYFMLYAGAIRAGHVKVGQFLYQKC